MKLIAAMILLASSVAVVIAVQNPSPQIHRRFSLFLTVRKRLRLTFKYR